MIFILISFNSNAQFFGKKEIYTVTQDHIESGFLYLKDIEVKFKDDLSIDVDKILQTHYNPEKEYKIFVKNTKENIIVTEYTITKKTVLKTRYVKFKKKVEYIVVLSVEQENRGK